MSELNGEISDELKNFIRRYVSSVSLLEVLILLKQNPLRQWSPQDLSQEMRSNLSYASLQLSELKGKKLVSSQDAERYWYDSNNSNAHFVDRLEELYNSRRPTVINFIYAQPIDSIREFANAFKIKKD